MLIANFTILHFAIALYAGQRRGDMKKNYILMLMALLFMVTVMGCNTMSGAGKDMQNAGKSVQKSADQNK
jgi:predicted small secreted protein